MGQVMPFDLITPTRTDTVHAARLTVCGMAQDVDDARMLLDLLGLLNDDRPADGPGRTLRAVH